MKQVIALHIQTSTIHLCCNVVLRCHRPGSLRESRVLCGSIESQIIGEVTRVALKMQSWTNATSYHLMTWRQNWNIALGALVSGISSFDEALAKQPQIVQWIPVTAQYSGYWYHRRDGSFSYTTKTTCVLKEQAKP